MCRRPPSECRVSESSALPKVRVYAYDASRDKCRKVYIVQSRTSCALAGQQMFQTKYQCETRCMAGRYLPQLPYHPYDF